MFTFNGKDFAIDLAFAEALVMGLQAKKTPATKIEFMLETMAKAEAKIEKVTKSEVFQALTEKFQANPETEAWAGELLEYESELESLKGRMESVKASVVSCKAELLAIAKQLVEAEGLEVDVRVSFNEDGKPEVAAGGGYKGNGHGGSVAGRAVSGTGTVELHGATFEGKSKDVQAWLEEKLGGAITQAAKFPAVIWKPEIAKKYGYTVVAH